MLEEHGRPTREVAGAQLIAGAEVPNGSHQQTETETFQVLEEMSNVVGVLWTFRERVTGKY